MDMLQQNMIVTEKNYYGKKKTKYAVRCFTHTYNSNSLNKVKTINHIFLQVQVSILTKLFHYYNWSEYFFPWRIFPLKQFNPINCISIRFY